MDRPEAQATVVSKNRALPVSQTDQSDRTAGDPERSIVRFSEGTDVVALRLAQINAMPMLAALLKQSFSASGQQLTVAITFDEGGSTKWQSDIGTVLDDAVGREFDNRIDSITDPQGARFERIGARFERIGIQDGHSARPALALWPGRMQASLMQPCQSLIRTDPECGRLLDVEVQCPGCLAGQALLGGPVLQALAQAIGAEQAAAKGAHPDLLAIAQHRRRAIDTQALGHPQGAHRADTKTAPTPSRDSPPENVPTHKSPR